MGGLLSLFSPQPSGVVRASGRDKDLFKLKLQRDRIRMYIRRLETEIQSEQQIAKEHLRNNLRNLAGYSVSRKKCMGKILDQMLDQEANLSNVISQIEHSALQVDVFEALKKGNAIMKKLNQALTIEDVEKLHMETREAIKYQEKIDTRIRSLNLVEDYEVEEDLNDLLNELKTAAVSSGTKSGWSHEEIQPLAVDEIVFPKPASHRAQQAGGEKLNPEPVILG